MCLVSFQLIVKSSSQFNLSCSTLHFSASSICTALIDLATDRTKAATFIAGLSAVIETCAETWCDKKSRAQKFDDR